MPSGRFWFCLKHRAVESGEDVCGPADRLGPYETAEEAERALERVQDRNEEWESDPNWNDRGPGSGPVG